MLVLTRKPGEKIRLGSEITVTVLDINGNRVRIGIDAPDRVSILRCELEKPEEDLDRQISPVTPPRQAQPA
ncbi:MAG TPA: carbon storage regulator [Gemmataceae bacterium]|jgi:carbon storage regulator|nr:carbon storage regulator [Gemmataceae bacterium]